MVISALAYYSATSQTKAVIKKPYNHCWTNEKVWPMPIEWFYTVEGEPRGPITGSQLKERARLGQVTKESYVKKGREGKWVPATRVRGLFSSSVPRLAGPENEIPPVPGGATEISTEHREEAMQSPPPVPPVIPPLSTARQPTSVSSGRKSHPRKRLVSLVTLSGLACLAYFAYGYFRNVDLREKLRSCSSYGVVAADVYYRELFSTETVVFDLGAEFQPGVRRIDPVHLLMQFADKLDLYSIKRVVLSREGRERFFVAGSDLKRLSDSYAGGGRIWAFNNLPERVRNLDGTPAYETWEGGWLGVLQKQAEDVNEFIRAWTGS